VSARIVAEQWSGEPRGAFLSEPHSKKDAFQ
jgi:hypothetical protein